MTIRIAKLTIKNFRGVESASYTFKEGINIFKGRNASGKTSTINAITILLTPDLTEGDKTNLLRNGASEFSVTGIFILDNGKMTCEINSKKFLIDGVAYAKTEYYKQINNILGVDSIAEHIFEKQFIEALQSRDASQDNNKIRTLVLNAVNNKGVLFDSTMYSSLSETIDTLNSDVNAHTKEVKTTIKTIESFLKTNNFNPSKSFEGEKDNSLLHKRLSEINAEIEDWRKYDDVTARYDELNLEIKKYEYNQKLLEQEKREQQNEFEMSKTEAKQTCKVEFEHKKNIAYEDKNRLIEKAREKAEEAKGKVAYEIQNIQTNSDKPLKGKWTFLSIIIAIFTLFIIRPKVNREPGSREERIFKLKEQMNAIDSELQDTINKHEDNFKKQIHNWSNETVAAINEINDRQFVFKSSSLLSATEIQASHANYINNKAQFEILLKQIGDMPNGKSKEVLNMEKKAIEQELNDSDHDKVIWENAKRTYDDLIKVKETHEAKAVELSNELKQKMTDKAQYDKALAEQLDKLFNDKDINIKLFNKNSKPAFILEYKGVSYKNLNSSQQRKLAMDIQKKFISGNKINTFQIVDNIELFSNFTIEEGQQIIGAKVVDCDLTLGHEF